ncbi:hypothetical protein B0H17DRAFT_207022 [Mycena rosella]|uniref:Uncharacterized protein n=1 Tax=Mycena rosella TaxID=1033263 RepID=A0AAD7CYH5_MYCRO|nr:hypothetical protein B0H17DRAFT_207022 [Mycena rosella]
MDYGTDRSPALSIRADSSCSSSRVCASPAVSCTVDVDVTTVNAVLGFSLISPPRRTACRSLGPAPDLFDGRNLRDCQRWHGGTLLTTYVLPVHSLFATNSTRVRACASAHVRPMCEPCTSAAHFPQWRVSRVRQTRTGFTTWGSTMMARPSSLGHAQFWRE